MYYITHSGIKGMHWGVRRFQNEDGSLTAAGRARYGDGGAPNGSSGGTGGTSNRKAKVKKALKIAAGVAVAAGAAYGAYRLSKHPAVAAALSRGVNKIRDRATSLYNRGADLLGRGKTADMNIARNRDHYLHPGDANPFWTDDNVRGGQVALGRYGDKGSLHGAPEGGLSARDAWDGSSKRTQRGGDRAGRSHMAAPFIYQERGPRGSVNDTSGRKSAWASYGKRNNRSGSRHVTPPSERFSYAPGMNVKAHRVYGQPYRTYDLGALGGASQAELINRWGNRRRVWGRR